jgi:uncharacterized membrane protein
VTFGPVQMLILEFDSASLKGEILPELTRLREGGLIRLIDLLVVTKDLDGEIVAVEATDLGLEEAQEFGAVVGALIGLGADGVDGAEIGAAAGSALAADGSVLDGQVWYVADAIPAGATAAIALIEHVWATPLRDAIRGAGGVMIADEWIHPEDLVAIGIAATETP